MYDVMIYERKKDCFELIKKIKKNIYYIYSLFSILWQKSFRNIKIHVLILYLSEPQVKDEIRDMQPEKEVNPLPVSLSPYLSLLSLSLWLSFSISLFLPFSLSLFLTFSSSFNTFINLFIVYFSILNIMFFVYFLNIFLSP